MQRSPILDSGKAHALQSLLNRRKEEAEATWEVISLSNGLYKLLGASQGPIDMREGSSALTCFSLSLKSRKQLTPTAQRVCSLRAESSSKAAAQQQSARLHHFAVASGCDRRGIPPAVVALAPSPPSQRRVDKVRCSGWSCRCLPPRR